MTNPRGSAPEGLVRAALQLLPTPPHTDHFWEDLERAIDAQDNAARPARRSSVVGPEPDAEVSGAAAAPDIGRAGEGDPALALLPGALRRTSNALLVMVAAATIVVVALAGTTLLTGRSQDQRRADEARAPAVLDALVERARGGDAPPDLSAAERQVSSSTVTAWIADLASGDSAAAWRALGPTSQAHFGTQAGFEAEIDSLAERYAGWAESPPEDVLVTPVLASDDGTLVAVTLIGTITDEGQQARHAAAVPVRLVDGRAQLEPYASAGELELVVPAGVSSQGSRATVGTRAELVVVLPSAALAPVLRLDGGEALICGSADGTQLSLLEDTPAQRCSYGPSGGIEAGEHTLTVAFSSADGAAISVRSIVFEAA